MQVNSEMAPQFHLKPEQLLEPCTNLRVGAAVLISVYTDLAREMGEGSSALDVALSFYNSGNAITGFRNGYVSNLPAHAPRRLPPFLIASIAIRDAPAATPPASCHAFDHLFTSFVIFRAALVASCLSFRARAISRRDSLLSCIRYCCPASGTSTLKFQIRRLRLFHAEEDPVILAKLF